MYYYLYLNFFTRVIVNSCVHNSIKEFKVRKSLRIYSTAFFKINYLVDGFLVVRGLCRCTRVFSSCGELGLLLGVVHVLLTAGVSLTGPHRL